MNPNYFPITKSFLCEKAIARKLEDAFSLSDVRCQLLTATMRDVYLVTSSQGKKIFYLYRSNQRTSKEIAAEWFFVGYLFANNIPVAPAIANCNGEYLLEFNAPEGIRYGVLTTYVEGDHFRRRPSTKAALELGRSVARIHILSDEMPTKLNRPESDVNLQLERYVTTFALEFPERKKDIDFLRQVVDYIHPKVADLPKTTPYYGMIHGDIIRANAQVSKNEKVTILDFDLCGPGWRVYDIASFLITLQGSDNEEFKQAYLDGYTMIRSLDDFERGLIPLFETIREVFTIGIPVMNLHHWGKSNIEPWFKFSFENLEQCMKRFDGTAGKY